MEDRSNEMTFSTYGGLQFNGYKVQDTHIYYDIGFRFSKTLLLLLLLLFLVVIIPGQSIFIIYHRER